MAHTPDPWVISGNGLIIRNKEGVHVCLMHTESKDSAPIIAAAPDMLAALQMVRDYMEVGKEQFQLGDEMVFRHVIAAIDKALNQS